MDSSTVATATNGDTVDPEDVEEHGSHEKTNKRTKLEKYLDRKERLRKAHKIRKQERRKQALLSGLEVTPRLPKPQIVKMSESSCKTRVVLDCAYDHMMSFKDICKLAHQISNCYSINRHLPSPVQLYVTGLGSAFRESSTPSQVIEQRQPSVPETASSRSTSDHDAGCVRTRPPASKSTLSRLNLVSAENWDLFLKMEDFTELFPATSIVYLCAEADDELPDEFISPGVNSGGEEGPKFTSDDVYVIGGLVDHNSHVGFCHRQASERGHRTARLPLDRTGIVLSGRKVLSLMHVFQALAGVLGGGLDWTTSLNAALPSRKCATSTMTPAPFYAATLKHSSSSSDISHPDNLASPLSNEPP